MNAQAFDASVGQPRDTLTVFLEVYVVLGKALIRGRRTVEGHERLLEAARITRVRRRADVHPVIVFTGWAGKGGQRSEGVLLDHAFEGILEFAGLKWPGTIIVEEQARSTVENIKNAVDSIKKEFPTGRIIRFHLVSTDYHIDRMWEVDEYLPELSDLEPLRTLGREVVLVRSPYIYATCGDPEREWLAAGYLNMHRLALLQVNLLGLGGNVHPGKGDRPRDVKPGTIRELRSVPFQTLRDTKRALDDLKIRVPTPGPVRDKIEQACEKLPEVLQAIESLDRDLEPLLNRPFDEESVPMWIGFQTRIDAIIYPLRTKILDPDEQG